MWIVVAYINRKTRLLNMNTHDYQQQSGQGCLSVCLAYLCQLRPSSSYERFMMREGHMRCRDSFALGMIDAFLSKYQSKDFNLEVCVSNAAYARYLSQQNKRNNVTIVHDEVFRWLELYPNDGLIVCLDSHMLGSFAHSPHYILVLARCPKTFKIYDPWTGKVSHVGYKKIVQGITLLEQHLGYSKLAIRLVTSPVPSQQKL